MGWLDKLLGRGKKAADDMMGSMKHEGMHQDEQAMSSERAEGAGQMAQEEPAAEHQTERENT
jgi:hypothetical protein